MFAATFGLWFVAMGSEWAFEPGSWEASDVWLLISFGANLVIGIISGFICVLIAKSTRAPLTLAVVVFALGIVFAIPAIVAQESATSLVRRGEFSQVEAMEHAREPLWAPFTVPFIGALGVLVGGKLKKQT